MLSVSATTQKIQAKLAGAAATTEPWIVAAYAPLTESTQKVALTTARIQTTGGTAVDVVPAPSSGVPNQLKYWTVVNGDTAPVTFTVQLVDSSGSVTAISVKVVLAVGDQLAYAGGDTWQVMDANGGLKTTMSTTFAGITSGTNTAAAMIVGAGASLTYTSTGTINASSVGAVVAATMLRGGLGISVDGGGSVISTGAKGFLEIPYACIITGWSLVAADGSSTGSMVMDVWRDDYAHYPPNVTDTITASDKPTITTSSKGQNTNASTWLQTCALGDWLGFNVDSCSIITRAQLCLRTTRI